MSEHDPPPDDNVLDPAMLVGVWANGTRVHRGRDELTVDFVRRVPESDAPFLVARTLLPLVAAFELRDELARVLQGYTEPDLGGLG